MLSNSQSLSLELFLKQLDFLAKGTSSSDLKSSSVSDSVLLISRSESKEDSTHPVWVSEEFWLKLTRMERLVSAELSSDSERRNKADYFQIITDFDHTLTHPAGGQCHDLILEGVEEHIQAQLQQCFTDSWAKRKEGPQTEDEFGSFWTEYNRILARNDFSEEDLSRIFESSKVRFRGQCTELFDFTERRDIPVLVASAGIENLIELVLNHNGYLRHNVAVFANRLIFDSDRRGQMLFTPESRLLVSPLSMTEHDSDGVEARDDCGAILIPAAVESKQVPISPTGMKKKGISRKSGKDKAKGEWYSSSLSAKGVSSHHSLSLKRMNTDGRIEPVSPVIIPDYWSKAEEDRESSESGSTESSEDEDCSAGGSGISARDSRIVGFGPLIHSRSKHGLYELCKEHFDRIRRRPLAVCMGDSVGDAAVTDQVSHVKESLKIGFVNFDIREDPERWHKYQNAFDLLITEPEASMRIPLQILRFLTSGDRSSLDCPQLRSDVFCDAKVASEGTDESEGLGFIFGVE